MAAATRGPYCPDFDLYSMDEELGMCNPATRRNKQESIKFRIHKGSTVSRRVPMIARHPVMGLSGVTEHSTQASNRTAHSSPRCCRTPPPIDGSDKGEGSHLRNRSPSIPRSRPSSPGALDPAVLEAVRNRARRVQQARLYLLQQTGPNSFLVGGDSPEHKYSVVIGPQACSCGRGPHCLHLLFVMLRVFQLPESDSRIYAKELKNFEVESLFHNYQERRNLRVNVLPDDIRKDVEQLQCESASQFTPQSESSSRCTAESPPASDVRPAEEELCPICLLEMVDGESLVICVTGCRNKLHHHCMSIWAGECYQQSETVLCPLCRHPWINEAVTAHSKTRSLGELECKQKVSTFNSVDPPHMVHKVAAVISQQVKKSRDRTLESELPCTLSPGAVSPLTSFGSGSSGYKSLSSDSAQQAFQEVLADSGVIPPEQLPAASEWAKVFGTDLVLCLYSRGWKAREAAVRKLMNCVVTSHYCGNEEKQQQVLQCCIVILTMVVADPVFEVYLGCIRCFKVLLNYASCRSKYQMEEFQALIRPIVRVLLLKCADRNHRTAHLSAEVLVELAKGRNGELSLGSHVSDSPICRGFEGLELILGCVLEEWSFDTVSWQWLAGRLIILDRLIQDFPDEFWLQYLPLYPSESGYKLHNYNRLITVVEFSFRALQSPRRTVAKLARRVFVISSSMTAKEHRVFNQVLEMLSDLDHSLQVRLRKRIHQVATECGAQSRVTGLGPGLKKTSADRCVEGESYHDQHKTRPVGSVPLDTSAMLQPLISPLMVKCSSLNVACQTGLLQPSDVPKVKNKKPVKFHHLQGTSPVQVSLSKCWGGSRSKLLSLFANKKKDELLPTKPELNGIYRGTCSPLRRGCKNCQVGDGHQHVEQCHSFPRSLSSKVMAQTTTPAPHAMPLQGIHKADHAEEYLDGMREELVLPLDLSDLKNHYEREIPFIPGLNSPLELDDSAVHPQDKNVEGGEKCSSYVEDLDWKRGQLLGTGAFSSCYQARDVATGTLMAVKQVPFCRNSEEEQAIIELGIREEILTMSKLRHENIVRILGATKQEGYFNMFVEWMAGGSVAGILDRYGPFNEEVIIHYTKQILQGLSYLHDNRILHRDLKGANLLIDSTGHHLRIGDFGTAARLVSQTTVPGEFQGQLLGTIAFMAPEVLRGEDYGRSCDVWSVGCCMIEMASAVPPWKENCVSNHVALMYKIASSKDPPSIPDKLSWAAKDLALQCLHINSELRPAAKELLHHVCFANW